MTPPGHPTVIEAAERLVGYWDGLDAVGRNDVRSTEDFAAEVNQRMDALRNALEQLRGWAAHG